MKTTRSLWPWGITLAFVLFALGIATMVVIACTHKVDLIRADYYDQEIKYQTQLDRLNRTAHLSDAVKIAYDGSTRLLTISLPPTHAGPDTVGRIEFYRPSATNLDRELKLELDANGVQTLDTTALIPGLWKVRVHWTAQQQEYFADQSIIVDRGERRRTGVAPVSNFSPPAELAGGSPGKTTIQPAAAKVTQNMETGATPVRR